tara:strand:- start:91 stop:1404 length:1314 start_codon:yes stop_codon:yes gene_type:complete
MKLKKLLRLYNLMIRLISNIKLLISVFFIFSCSEETIIYDEIENRDSTIQTAILPQTNNKLFQSFPQFITRDKLYFGSVKESENLYSLVQMTLFSGNIPPVTLVDLLADSIQVDSAMVYFQTEDSLSTEGFGLGLFSIISDNDSTFSDSLNYYTQSDFIDFESNSFLLNEAYLDPEYFTPDSTGLDTVKIMFTEENGTLESLKEYFLDTDTYPARTFMLKDTGSMLEELFSLESNESANGPKMRVWYKAVIDEQTTLDTFITFFSQKDITVFSPPEINDDDFNFISLNSGSGLRSIIEFDLNHLDSLSRNELFKNSNLVFDVASSNLNQDDEFYVIVSAIQDSVQNWSFTSPFIESADEEGDSSLELETSYTIDANFIISRKIEDDQVKIPIQAFLQGYKNGLFQHNELMLYSAPVNSPFDKVHLNLNAIEVMYVEP